MFIRIARDGGLVGGDAILICLPEVGEEGEFDDASIVREHAKDQEGPRA